MKKALFYSLTITFLILAGSVVYAAKLDNQPPIRSIQCGDTIYDDTVLTNDLTDCPGNGLIIGANNITLDCDNHTINGIGTGYGVVLDNRKNCAIKDCKIKGFQYGVYIDKIDPGFDDNYIISNLIEENTDTGLYIQASQRDNIYGNVFQHNTEYNAYETGGAIGNYWVSGFDTGNSWDDLLENPCYPPYYCIDGPGDGIDYAPSIVDSDGDGIADDQDNCPYNYNPFQWDCDEDGIGDACDEDTIDEDNDGVDDACDNCLGISNVEQIDEDGDDYGYPCDCHEQDPYINPETVDHCLGRWNYVGLYGISINAIDIAKTNPDFMWAGTNDGLWKSQDAGKTWQLITADYLNENSYIMSLAISPVDENTVYVGSDTEPAKGGILYTHDGGLTWNFTYFGFPYYAVEDIEIPDSGEPVYLEIKGYIYRSYNDFLTFENVSPASSINYIELDPSDYNYMLATYAVPPNSPVFFSQNGGLDWTSYQPSGFKNWEDIKIIPGHEKSYLGAHCEGVYRLDNFSLPLIPKNNGLTNPCILCLEVNKLKPEIIYAGTGYSDKGFFRSNDEAENWYEMSEGLKGNSRRVKAIASHPTDPNIIFIGSDGIFKHYNAGLGFEHHFEVGDEETCNQPGGCFGEDENDKAYCDFENNCVWQEMCYMGRKSGELGVANVDGNLGLAVCVGDSWWDCDTHKPGLELCEECDWSYDLPGCSGDECLVPSAQPNVGEYDYLGAVECCGDDEGEIYLDGQCWSSTSLKNRVKHR